MKRSSAIAVVLGMIMGAMLMLAPHAQPGMYTSHERLKEYSSIEQMGDYVEFAKGELERFNEENGLSSSMKWVHVPAGTSALYCGSTEPVESKYVFGMCPMDGTIYTSDETMWKYYQIAWYAPMIALIHEDGHYQQAVHGEGFSNVTSPVDVQAVEAQADCFAGVWAGRLPPWMTRFTKSSEIATLFADAEAGEQKMISHGGERKYPVPEDRLHHYYEGHDSHDLHACNTALTSVA